MKKIVLQSDFGLTDGAVSAMEGVIVSHNPNLSIHHLTHNIPPFDIFSASYRLFQTLEYWPEDTVFVSIVDPTVGKSHPSIVVVLKSGQILITPDNGTVTHLKHFVGIDAVYEIDKDQNILRNHHQSFTFFGRDLYSYNAARIAAGTVKPEDLGRRIHEENLVLIPLNPVKVEDHKVIGQIDIYDDRFGSLWTNIHSDILAKEGIVPHTKLNVKISHYHQIKYESEVYFGESFIDVAIGAPILYINSLERLALAINQGNFKDAFGVGRGEKWRIEVSLVK